jgi:hypothetical protein
MAYTEKSNREGASWPAAPTHPMRRGCESLVRFIAIPAIMGALFSYRRAAQLRKRRLDSSPKTAVHVRSLVAKNGLGAGSNPGRATISNCCFRRQLDRKGIRPECRAGLCDEQTVTLRPRPTFPDHRPQIEDFGEQWSGESRVSNHETCNRGLAPPAPSALGVPVAGERDRRAVGTEATRELVETFLAPVHTGKPGAEDGRQLRRPYSNESSTRRRSSTGSRSPPLANSMIL